VGGKQSCTGKTEKGGMGVGSRELTSIIKSVFSATFVKRERAGRSLAIGKTGE